AFGEMRELRRSAGAGRRAAHELLDQPPRDGRSEQRLAGGDYAHGLRELLWADVLEQKTARAGLHRLVDVLVEIESGEDEDSYAVAGSHQPARRLEAVELGHADVHQHDVRPEVRGLRDRLASISRLSNHGHVLLHVEDQAKAAAHE